MRDGENTAAYRQSPVHCHIHSTCFLAGKRNLAPNRTRNVPHKTSTPTHPTHTRARARTHKRTHTHTRTHTSTHHSLPAFFGFSGGGGGGVSARHPHAALATAGVVTASSPELSATPAKMATVRSVTLIMVCHTGAKPLVCTCAE